MANADVRAELKALRKRLYTYHNELLEIERQSKLCRDAYDEISKRRRCGGSDDEDEEDPVDAFSSSHVPLKNEYILEMIANYLPNQDVKTCKLVCRLWSKEMARCLSKRKALIVTDEDCPEASELLDQYAQRDLVSISNLCFFDVRTTSTLHKKLMAAFGWTLSGLKLEECKVTPISLAQLLTKKAPNLESFSFKDRASTIAQVDSTFTLIQNSIGSDHEFSLPDLKRLHWDEEFGRVKLEEIIQVCPNLIELVYKNTPIPNSPDFKRLRWNSLRTLKLSPRDELREEHFVCLASLKMKLRRLTLFGINPKGKARMQKLRKFLQSVAPTMEELELFQHYTIAMMPYNPDYESPFPVNLPEVKRLSMDFCILKSLKTVSSMPRLKMMDCRSKTATEWQVVLKNGVPKEHKNLTHINIGSVDSRGLLKFAGCFKVLTNLELDAVKIDDEALRTVIKGFPQLQQFKLSKIPLCSRLELTDSGITGLPTKICEKIRIKKIDLATADFSADRKYPCIQDLKELYRLELSANESTLSDIAVFLGITKLPKLLILGLPRCEITDLSLIAIQERLPALTMLELPGCEKVSSEAVETLKLKRKDMIIQSGLGAFGKFDA